MEDFEFRVYLERCGRGLCLRCITCGAGEMGGAGVVLMVHGVTFSSHEFDINYKDYSMARMLARHGYSVWLLDISGFGHSEAVSDGFMADSECAAADIGAAVEAICAHMCVEQIDVLGWSWGTVTTSLYASRHPERVRRLILYAPLLGRLPQMEVSEPFHTNTWDDAVGDFRRDESGELDYAYVEKEVADAVASSCWRHDGLTSPNGGRRDIFSGKQLIFTEKLTMPTFFIYGTSDPYLDYEMLERAELPVGSRKVAIEGGGHGMCLERPFYKEFQRKLLEIVAE